MGFRLFSSSFSTNESDCPVQIGESFSTSAGRYCHHVKPRFPCFIKVWLSRLPRSNVISLNRMVEEGRSWEAHGCQALILWPVPIIPASLEAKGLRGFISPLTSDDWKLLQKFPQPSSQKKKKKPDVALGLASLWWDATAWMWGTRPRTSSLPIWLSSDFVASRSLGLFNLGSQLRRPGHESPF